jgi:hypothetical protein
MPILLQILLALNVGFLPAGCSLCTTAVYADVSMQMHKALATTSQPKGWQEAATSLPCS